MTQTPRDWFTYSELLAIWDGLNSLPRNSEIHHAGEKVSVEELKKKVESLASTLYPDTPAPKEGTDNA